MNNVELVWDDACGSQRTKKARLVGEESTVDRFDRAMATHHGRATNRAVRNGTRVGSGLHFFKYDGSG